MFKANSISSYPPQTSKRYTSKGDSELSLNVTYTVCQISSVGSVQVDSRVLCQSSAK